MAEVDSTLGHEAIAQLIFSRSSTKKFSDDPVPRNDIETLLAAAVRAPDHGLLAPWRFIVLQGESRGVLSRAMQQAFASRNPVASDDMLEREGSKAWRSPVLIVVIAHFQSHPKVPDTEQLLAVGAAVQNLWLTAASLGLGVAWKTGSHAYDPIVRSALDVGSNEQIVGFIHIGRPIAQNPVRQPEYVSRTRWG